MADRQWYYVLGGERYGPFPEVELTEAFRRRLITGDTLVWSQGLPDWKPLRTVPGIDLPQESPPPIPAAARPAQRETPPPVPQHARPLATAAAPGEPKKASVWWGKVETREQALSIIKQVAIMFYIVAVVMAVFMMLMKQYGNLFDSFLYAICAALVQWKQSRAAAIILFLWSLLIVVITFMSKAGLIEGAGGTNWVLSFIVAWAAFRCVRATFSLPKLPVATTG